MLKKKYVELINKKIDGLLTTSEDHYLTSYLDKNQTAKKYYNDISASMSVLENLDELSPPSSIKLNIINAIDPALYAPKKYLIMEKNTWPYLFKHAPRVGLAFAAGLLLGVFMFSVYENNNSLNNRDLYGAIGLAAEDQYTIIDQIPLNSFETKGLITIKKSSALYLLDIRMENIIEGQLLIEYDPAQLFFNGFESYEQSDSHLENNNGLLKLSIEGRNHSQLKLKELSELHTELKFQIKTAQNVIVSKTINLSKQ